MNKNVTTTILSVFCLFLFGYTPTEIYGQSYSKKENNIWIGGGLRWIASGLDFNTGNPQHIYGAAQSVNNTGYASVCDQQGHLLFYSDGNIVWGRDNTVMPHGWDINNDGTLAAGLSYIYNSSPYTTSISSNSSSNGDGVVIMPMPGNSHKYYVFNVVGVWDESISTNLIFLQLRWEGKLRYSIVDMELNNGMGDVESDHKGILLADSMGGNLHGVVAEDCGNWLLAIGSNGSYNAFKVTTAGVSGQPVVSSLTTSNFTLCTELNISPNRLIAAQSINDPFSSAGEVQVMDFDPLTGMFSNTVSLGTQFGWHTAFSPDNSKLYISGLVGLRQYATTNLSLPFSLLAFNTAVAETDNPLRLGPNGKIYFTSYLSGSAYGGVIQQPNLAGSACQMDTIPNPPLMLIKEPGYQFPNEIPVLQYDSLSATVERPLCFDQAEVRVYPSDTLGTDYHWKKGNTDLHWTLGDSSAFLNVYDPGIYTVQYYTSDPCAFHQDTVRVERVYFSLDLGDDRQSCNGEAVTLEVDLKDALFLWPDNTTASSFTADSSGYYWVQATQKGCIFRDSIWINITDIKQSLGSDTVLCLEDDPQQINLDARVPDGSVVLWSTGSSAPSILAADSGTYWVRVTDSNCVGADSITIDKIFCYCPTLFPTAFSPNGDGNNDQYIPVMSADCEVSDYKLLIYNRWGQMVFSSFKKEQGWDGTYHSSHADAGTYMYRFQMKVTERGVQKEIKKNGDFLLIR